MIFEKLLSLEGFFKVPFTAHLFVRIARETDEEYDRIVSDHEKTSRLSKVFCLCGVFFFSSEETHNNQGF